MKKYEYMKLSDVWGKEITGDLLSKYGEGGWKLVHVINYPGSTDFILEKELEEVPDELEKEMD